MKNVFKFTVETLHVEIITVYNSKDLVLYTLSKNLRISLENLLETVKVVSDVIEDERENERFDVKA